MSREVVNVQVTYRVALVCKSLQIHGKHPDLGIASSDVQHIRV